MVSRFIVPSFIFVVVVMVLGCSGGGQNPVAPSTSESTTLNLTHQGSGAYNSHALWGLWEVVVDPVRETIEAQPLRGAMFNANVVRFLQPPSSPVHLLSVSINPGSDLSTGYADINVTLRHPFPGLKRFRGFDVRGVVMAEGDVAFAVDPSALRSGPGELRLLNADGWSRWWNPAEFTTFDTILGYTHGTEATPGYLATATVNPYKYFADELDEDEPLAVVDPVGRGSFSVDVAVNTRRYVLQFPMWPGGPSYRFNYAVDASWAVPSEDLGPDYPVEAFPLEANMQEAWQVSISDGGSTAWYVADDSNGGALNLSVEVYDWQGALQVSGVGAEVASIWVECPILTDLVDLTLLADPAPAGPGSSVWSVELTELTLTSAGDFDCWVGVESTHPANYAPQIEGDPGVFDWPDVPLTAFAHGAVNVAGVNPQSAPVVLEVIPSRGLVSTVAEEVRIVGNWFQSGASVAFDFDVSTSLGLTNVTWVDDHLITCDVDCAGPLGFYDVTVTNPDMQEGTLEDGFEVAEEWGCEGSAHDWGAEYEIDGLSYNPDFHRFDMAILTQGSRAGMALYQMDRYDWGVIDPAGGGGQTIEFFLTSDPDYCYCVDIETCEVTGRIVILSLFKDHLLWIYDAEGNRLGDFAGVPESENYTCMDFDRNGDMWAVIRTGGSDPTEWEFELRHFALVEDEPFYQLVPQDTVNIDNLALTGPVGSRHIGDLGVSFYLHRLFIFTANTSDDGSNRITGWDLNESPPVVVADHQNPYPPLTRHHRFSQGALSRKNIDVDHRYPNDPDEQCRIYAYSTVWTDAPSMGLDCYTIRLDGDLNILDVGEIFHLPWPLEWDDIPQCTVVYDAGPDAQSNLFGCGWNGTDFSDWPAPPDW